MSAAVLVSASQPQTTDYVNAIRSQLEKTIRGFIEIGRLLAEAQEVLGRKQWLMMVTNDLPFTRRTAEKLVKIAGDSRLTDQRYVGKLPPHWTSLHEITLLEDEQFERGISEGVIHPDAERKHITALKERRPPQNGNAPAPASAHPNGALAAGSHGAAAVSISWSSGHPTVAFQSDLVAKITSTASVQASSIGPLMEQIKEICARHFFEVEFSPEYRRQEVRELAERRVRTKRDEFLQGTRDNDVLAIEEAFHHLETGNGLVKNSDGSYLPQDVRNHQSQYYGYDLQELYKYCMDLQICTKYTPIEFLDPELLTDVLVLRCFDGGKQEQTAAIDALGELAKSSPKAAYVLEAINAK